MLCLTIKIQMAQLLYSFNDLIINLLSKVIYLDFPYPLMNCKYINRKDFPPQDCTISEISQEKQKEDTKLHCFNANRTHTSHPRLHFPRFSQRKQVTIFLVKTHTILWLNRDLQTFFFKKSIFNRLNTGYH